VTYENLPRLDHSLSDEVVRQVEIAVKYEGYIRRQEVDVNKLRSMEEADPRMDGLSVDPDLRMESRQKRESSTENTGASLTGFRASLRRH
jgi:tRNA uridine 5-carboxymethylaminomethyl modification enzyme